MIAVTPGLAAMILVFTALVYVVVDEALAAPGEAHDEDDEAPVRVEAIKDASDQVLVFRVSDELDEETEAEYVEQLTQLADSAKLQSSVLVMPEEIDISEVRY